MKYNSISDMAALEEELKTKLKPDRFRHVIGVAHTGANLAMKYNVSIEKAYLAGLLHDCAKAYSTDLFIEMCKDHNIEISEYEEESPHLLHAKLGAYYAKEMYEVNDEEILNAIRCHTTGKPNMTMLEKILFTADYIEPGRNKAKRLSQIRLTAYNDIDEAIRMILYDTMELLITKGYVIDPLSEKTYNYYVGENE